MKNKHNYYSVEQFKDEDGRVKISPEIMRLLKPIPTNDLNNPYKKNIIKDKHLLGFMAIASVGGTKTFMMRIRPKKKEKGKYSDHLYFKLGNYFDSEDPNNKTGITCHVARKMAEEIRNEFRLGRDPYRLIASKKTGKSIVDITRQFERARLDSSAYKEKTKVSFMSIINLYIYRNSKNERHKRLYRISDRVLAALDRPIKSITKDDYVAIHRAVSEIAKYSANRLIELLRLIEKYAFELNLIDKRVCSFKKKELNKEYKRVEIDTPYSMFELKKYRRSALTLVKQEYERYLIPTFQLLTCALIGARSKSQVFKTMWSDLNEKTDEIIYKDTKNNEPQRIQYDYRFKAILRMMRSYRDKNINHKDKRYKYIFPSLDKTYKTKYLNDPRKTHITICNMAGIKVLPIHFLRHSWATNDYEAHGDIYATKENGGWKDINSVMVYAKLSNKIKKQRLEQQRKSWAKKSHVA
jgi:hypothetical protein